MANEENREYKRAHSIQTHVPAPLKSLVLEHVRQSGCSRSEIVETALKMFYDSKPELTERLRSSMDKHHY